MMNLNLGRTLLFADGTKEIKILSFKPDARGMLMARITDLVTGHRSLVPVKCHGVMGRTFRPGVKIEICA